MRSDAASVSLRINTLIDSIVGLLIGHNTITSNAGAVTYAPDMHVSLDLFGDEGATFIPPFASPTAPDV